MKWSYRSKTLFGLNPKNQEMKVRYRLKVFIELRIFTKAKLPFEYKK